jgi:hypothetical protein
MSHLDPVTTYQPETCDGCGAVIPKHAMIYFAQAEGWKLCCSPICAQEMEKPQPPEAA